MNQLNALSNRVEYYGLIQQQSYCFIDRPWTLYIFCTDKFHCIERAMDSSIRHDVHMRFHV